jgi:hypothetical protein
MSLTERTRALLRGDPVSELAAAQLSAAGLTISQIAARFQPPLSVEHARIAITRGRYQLAARAYETVTAIADGIEPTRLPCVLTAPAAELLAWAERDGPNRAKTLAARIQRELRDLRGAMARTEIITWAQSEGYTVSMSGSVPRDLMALFNATYTHGGDA